MQSVLSENGVWKWAALRVMSTLHAPKSNTSASQIKTGHSSSISSRGLWYVYRKYCLKARGIPSILASSFTCVCFEIDLTDVLSPEAVVNHWMNLRCYICKFYLLKLKRSQITVFLTCSSLFQIVIQVTSTFVSTAVWTNKKCGISFFSQIKLRFRLKLDFLTIVVRVNNYNASLVGFP